MLLRVCPWAYAQGMLRISDLQTLSTFSGSELLPVVDQPRVEGGTKNTTMSNVRSWVLSSGYGGQILCYGNSVDPSIYGISSDGIGVRGESYNGLAMKAAQHDWTGDLDEDTAPAMRVWRGPDNNGYYANSPLLEIKSMNQNCSGNAPMLKTMDAWGYQFRVEQRGAVRLGTSTGPLILTGTGPPENNKAAPRGSLYLRTDGGVGTTFYVKQSGTGTTGWAAK